MLEIEKRGPLNNDNSKILKALLKENAQLTGKFNQLNIFIEFGSPFLGTVGNLKNSINISLSKNLLTNKISSKLKVKTGKAESTIRKELNIPFEYTNIDNILSFLNIFQITAGCPRFYYREDYTYKNLQISIKEKGLVQNHFEIEVGVEDKEGANEAIKSINSLAAELGLNFYSEEEYKEIMLKLFNDYPPVPFDQIDLGVIN